MAELVQSVSRLLQGYLDGLYTAMRDQRRAAQEALLEPDPTARMLDCGCREGENTLRLARRVGTTQPMGLDLNEGVLCQAAQHGILPLLADLNRSIPLADSSLDLIVASDVLEHLTDPRMFVVEMHRVLKPGGYLVLDTPNLASWHNIFALVLGMQPFSGPNLTTMEDADLGIVRRMHRSTHGLPEGGAYRDQGEHELTRHIVVVAYSSLLRMMNTVGFDLEVRRGFGYYPLPPFAARIFQRLDPRHSHHILLKARKPKV
jgi:SAM-dependent methyltransferase